MKVGLSVPRLGFQGGLEQHTWDLGRSLRERGHHVALLHGPMAGRDPDGYAGAFSEVRAIEGPPCASDLDVVWVQKASSVRALDPFGDVPLIVATHDHDLSCPRGHRYLPVGHAPCHRAAGPTCLAHGCFVVRERPNGARTRLGLRSPFALRRNVGALAGRGLLVANSHYVAAMLQGAGVAASRIRVVHPVPPDCAAPAVTPPPATPRLLVLGQLVQGKGVDLAIRGLRLLGSDVTLTVAGDGPSRARLEALARKQAPGRIHFLGAVAAGEVARLYDEARIVLVPSRWPEPFGMVGLEAMRRARPVVGAAHGGIVEWLLEGVSGRLFAPGSLHSLADAVRRVLAEPELGARAREFAASRYAHSRMVDLVETLLCDVRAGR